MLSPTGRAWRARRIHDEFDYLQLHCDIYIYIYIYIYTYHALRNSHGLDIDKAVSSSDFCDLLLIACEVMQYFSDELMHTST